MPNNTTNLYWIVVYRMCKESFPKVFNLVHLLQAYSGLLKQYV